jgi:hypothetical protein
LPVYELNQNLLSVRRPVLRVRRNAGFPIEHTESRAIEPNDANLRRALNAPGIGDFAAAGRDGSPVSSDFTGPSCEEAVLATHEVTDEELFVLPFPRERQVPAIR